MKERRNERREGSWSSALRYMQLVTLNPMEADVNSRHGLVVWLTAPVYRTLHIRRPPSPASALSFMTPDTPELTVHSPVLKRRW